MSHSTFLWGLFCACSWTWCIGMYLPVIMVDRYGWAGFGVFAVPNVLGCAAFGYLVRTSQRSRSMVRHHRSAMVAFSIVALAFHVFFATYLVATLWPAAGGTAGVIAVAAVMYGVALLLSGLRDRGWLGLAVLVSALALTAFVVLALDHGPRTRAVAFDVRELIWLAPIVCFGFMLCPYLDLTFHRALQQARSRHAFAVFGAAFAVMILLTLWVWGSEKLLVIAALHLIAQMVFTMGAHLRELGARLKDRNRRTAAALVPLAVLPLWPLLQNLHDTTAFGDETYLRFLVFYGLVFPAYALMFVGPYRILPVTSRTLTGLVLLVILLAPLYEMGFVHGRAWVLLVPAIIGLLWLVRSQRPLPATT